MSENVFCTHGARKLPPTALTVKADGRYAKWAEDGDRTKPQLLVNVVKMELLPAAEMARRMEVGHALLGERCRLMKNEFTGKRIQYFDKPPGTSSPTPPHQDNFYFNVLPPLAMTLWLAIDPADQGNGCLQYVSGSHRGMAVRPHVPTGMLGMSSCVEWTAADEARARYPAAAR